MSLILRILAAGLFVAPSMAQDVSPGASLALERARRAQYDGPFTAAVTCVRESFLGGTDTLRGVLESDPARGVRRLLLTGASGSFEWWSRGNGREQWRREGAGRPRRLPPHSLRKPSFAPDVSYEDLARLPFGPLDASRGARPMGETDSTVTFTLAPGAPLSTLYAGLEVTIGRNPPTLRRVVFAGNGVRPSKVMEIVRYAAEPDGMFPVEVAFASADGLTSARLLFERLAPDVARDKVLAPDRSAPDFAEPRWENPGAP